jgi:hypothetical protein
LTALPSLLAVLTAALQTHPLCKKVIVLETKEFSPTQFFFKVRAELAGESRLHVRVYYNRGHIDYAYQFLIDVPLLRWDNKEEFRHLATFPHHHHDEKGNVSPSPLGGDPIVDLPIVLQNISTFLPQHFEKDGLDDRTAQ